MRKEIVKNMKTRERAIKVESTCYIIKAINLLFLFFVVFLFIPKRLN